MNEYQLARTTADAALLVPVFYFLRFVRNILRNADAAAARHDTVED